MLLSIFAFPLFAGLVTAYILPTALSRSIAAANLTTLTANDIIVYGANGRIEVGPKEKYEYISSQDSSAFELTSSTPLDFTSSSFSTSSNPNVSGSRSVELQRRGCKYQTIIVENTDQTFLNWDVPMTSVVHATGLSSTIQIATGYTLANSIGVSLGATFTLVKDFLSETYSISYTETWTSSTTSAYTFAVEPGNYAAIVSNPRTLRKSGMVYEGCIGDATSMSSYQADSYTSQSWGSLEWVEGTISLCNGTTYPLPACIGRGLLY